MRYIKLRADEKEELKRLKNQSFDKMTQRRSHCLILSSEGRKIVDLADIFSVSRRTIERWFDAWDSDKFNSLSIKSGRGAKTRLQGYEKEVEAQLEKHNRNLKNVLLYFKVEFNIDICKRTLQNFLKDTGL